MKSKLGPIEKFRPLWEGGKSVEQYNIKIGFKIRMFVVSQITNQRQKNPNLFSQNEIEQLTKMIMDLKQDKTTIPIDQQTCTLEEYQKFLSDFFSKVDYEDRHSTVTIKTTSKFRLMASFIDVLSTWGPIDEEMIKCKKYCQYKAVDIFKALKKGEIPKRGGPKEQINNENENNNQQNIQNDNQYNTEKNNSINKNQNSLQKSKTVNNNFNNNNNNNQNNQNYTKNHNYNNQKYNTTNQSNNKKNQNYVNNNQNNKNKTNSNIRNKNNQKSMNIHQNNDIKNNKNNKNINNKNIGDIHINNYNTKNPNNNINHLNNKNIQITKTDKSNFNNNIPNNGKNYKNINNQINLNTQREYPKSQNKNNLKCFNQINKPEFHQQQGQNNSIHRYIKTENNENLKETDYAKYNIKNINKNKNINI